MFIDYPLKSVCCYLLWLIMLVQTTTCCQRSCRVLHNDIETYDVVAFFSIQLAVSKSLLYLIKAVFCACCTFISIPITGIFYISQSFLLLLHSCVYLQVSSMILTSPLSCFVFVLVFYLSIALSMLRSNVEN